MRFVLALLFLVRLAHADTGVVVSGDPTMQARVLDQVQRWLQDRHHVLVAAPLGSATSTFIDCFVIEDMACAKKVFASAKATTVVFVRVELAAVQSRDYTISAFWFTRTSAPATVKQTCTQCDDSALDAALTTLMVDLSKKGSNGKGQLQVAAGSPGMSVKVDGKELGEPPLTREIEAGSHELVFVHGGSPVDIRRIDVDAAGVVSLEAPHVAGSGPVARGGRRSRRLSAVLMATGVVAAAAGGVLLYYGSLRGPDEPYVYTNATEIGLPLALAGAFAVGAGASLWFAGSASDAKVGVTGSF